MAISLHPETQKLIEERMKETGVGTPDELVRLALQTLDQVRGEDFEDLDPATRAALDEGLAQADRGETRPWDEVREARTRFIDGRPCRNATASGSPRAPRKHLLCDTRHNH